jgi:hypothetical protein
MTYFCHDALNESDPQAQGATTLALPLVLRHNPGGPMQTAGYKVPTGEGSVGQTSEEAFIQCPSGLVMDQVSIACKPYQGGPPYPACRSHDSRCKNGESHTVVKIRIQLDEIPEQVRQPVGKPANSGHA